MSGSVWKGDIDVSLQRYRAIGRVLIRSCSAEGKAFADDTSHLLSAFGLIHELCERLGDVGQKPDPILFHELSDKRLADRWASESAAQIGQHGNLFFHAEHRGRHHVSEGDRVLHGLSQAIESTPRRFDGGGIEKLEEGFGVTSRNCCLNHGPCPITSTMGTRIIVVPSALK